MSKSLITLLFTAACLLAATYSYAQPGSVTGQVLNASGTPLVGATVTALNAAQGGITNAEGRFSFTLPRGKYRIQASMLGYASASEEVELTEGASRQVNFTLNEDLLGLGEVLVTGVINPKSKLASSISISSIDGGTLPQIGATNTAELFRTIPGIRSEASAGEGNTNITARGVPISAGGSKYLQLQEDGLPLLLYGDIAFATADIFLRADRNVARIEAIRGGSASTLASNSPAGIINLVSKTGEVAGGSVATSVGLGYNNLRTDFEVGSPLGNDMAFHVGGFFRQGEGVRTAGYTANYGGQVKANLTKYFGSGYARIHYKYLNDRAAAFMPMPIQVTGTNDNPTWASVPGFDALRGTLHTPYLLQNLGLGPDGQLRRSQVSDGMNPVSQAIGTEFAFEVGDGWRIENRNRLAFNRGRFVAPFPAAFGTVQSILDGIQPGLTTANLAYADNGAAYGNGVENNGLAMRIHMFDTELNNFNNFTNDLKLNKKLLDNKLNLTAGYFKAYQNISMSWLWNSYITDVNGNGMRLLNVTDTTGSPLTDGGLIAYGVPAWGNCCQRNYDVLYDISAPYFNAEITPVDALSLDLSARWDLGRVAGSFAGNAQSQADMNNNGVISAPEQSVSAIDNANRTAVNYTYRYLSYSGGLNYQLDNNSAAFVRASRGGSAKADRILFSGLNYTDSDKLNAKDLISQYELGYKGRFKHAGIFVTGFLANTTEEGGFEATTQEIIENDYRALGLELEASYSLNGFEVRAGATWTNATITSGADSLNRPRRQAALIYSLMPTYTHKVFTAGLAIYGTTASFAQNNNELLMPGYAIVNAFVQLRLAESLTIGLNGNNLLNALAITESEEGAITDGATNYLRARSAVGRTANLTLNFSF